MCKQPSTILRASVSPISTKQQLETVVLDRLRARYGEEFRVRQAKRPCTDFGALSEDCATVHVSEPTARPAASAAAALAALAAAFVDTALVAAISGPAGRAEPTSAPVLQMTGVATDSNRAAASASTLEPDVPCSGCSSNSDRASPELAAGGGLHAQALRPELLAAWVREQQLTEPQEQAMREFRTRLEAEGILHPMWDNSPNFHRCAAQSVGRGALVPRLLPGVQRSE